MARTKRSSEQIGVDRDGRPERIREEVADTVGDLVKQGKVRSFFRSFGGGRRQYPPCPCRPSGLRCRANIQRPSSGHFLHSIARANGSEQVALVWIHTRDQRSGRLITQGR